MISERTNIYNDDWVDDVIFKNKNSKLNQFNPLHSNYNL